MEERKGSPSDPMLSKAETLEGRSLAASPPPTGPAPLARPVPGFPVRDWDRYEFLGFLGQGGMGAVFLARDRQLGREVAIKFVRLEDAHHLQRFMVEARAQAQVDHANVCKVFEVGEVEGKVFITMQRIAGASLDLAAAGLSLEQKAMVLRDAARGVQEAHRVGIIHRDLKPSNIMVETAADGVLRTFVMDFGLAREWNQDVTETGSVLGTPAYMSPEQARGEVSRLDRRTDIYSLGATLYHLTTGRPPIAGSNPLEVLSAIGTAEVPSMRALRLDIPRDLEAITLKCLEKERGKRYDSAKALADDLDRFLAGEPVLARPTGLGYRLQRKLRKHRQVAAVAAVAILVVLAALGSTLRTRRDAGRRERLAQRFTESMARIESLARYSALSPLHDIRPDLQAVRAHMARLQEDMRQAGALADGPGHYALGRGHWTLDDGEQAREHLQMAWDAGFREPRAALALGQAIGREYQERLLEAERIPGADQREARKREVESSLRAPALAFLRQAQGSEGLAPAYVEALLAFYEGRLDEALDRLQSLGSGLPWFYEAPLLRGSLLQARAWKRWNQGDRPGAHLDFEAGRAALSAAAASGRSAPVVHAALAELELNALIMEKYGPGRVEPAFLRGMAAVDLALKAQSDHVPSLILKAEFAGQFADWRTSRGEPAGALVEQAVAAAEAAVAAGPARADARVALGKALYQWGNARQEQNLDPTPQLAKGLQALEALSTGKRDYSVENHLGLIHQTWSDFEEQRGRDPLEHLNGAIAAYERATRLDPHLLPAWINQGTCLRQRAAQAGAKDPEGDLQAAQKVLERARALNPRHFVPHFVLGNVFYDLALRRMARGEDPGTELQQSAAAFRQGLAINAQVPQLHNGLGLAQALQARWTWEAGGNPQAELALAQQSFRQAIALAPGQVFGHLNLGDLLIWRARSEPGAGSKSLLQEAEARLQRALAAAPGHKGALANLGRVQAARIEQALADRAEAAPALARGEALLAKALAVDPRDRDALQYLGELRAAAASAKAQQRRAVTGDFERALEALLAAQAAAPDSSEILLALARLWEARAEWERAAGGDPGPSLAQGRAWIERLRKARPRWAEPLLVAAALHLVEAEALPPEARGPKAREALQGFREAFALNPNLRGRWPSRADLAQGWGRTADQPPPAAKASTVSR